MHEEPEQHTLLVGGEKNPEFRMIRRVYKQRWSHFLHAAGILIFISPPFMHILGFTPTSVLAGWFLFMGEQSFSVNPIFFRFFYLLTPPSELPILPPSISTANPPNRKS
jgi:HCO3- transporter family